MRLGPDHPLEFTPRPFWDKHTQAQIPRTKHRCHVIINNKRCGFATYPPSQHIFTNMALSNSGVAIVVTFGIVVALGLLGAIVYQLIRRRARFQAQKLDNKYRPFRLTISPKPDDLEKGRSMDGAQSLPSRPNHTEDVSPWINYNVSPQSSPKHKHQSIITGYDRPLSYISRNGSVAPSHTFSRRSISTGSSSSSSQSMSIMSHHNRSDITYSPDSIYSHHQFGGVNPLLNQIQIPRLRANSASQPTLPETPAHIDPYAKNTHSDVASVVAFSSKADKLNILAQDGDLNLQARSPDDFSPQPASLPESSIAGKAITTDFKHDQEYWTANTTVTVGANLTTPPSIYLKTSQRQKQRRHHAVVS